MVSKDVYNILERNKLFPIQTELCEVFTRQNTLHVYKIQTEVEEYTQIKKNI